MSAPRHPALFQVNTHVWLHAFGTALGRPPTLDDVPDGELDGWATAGFDAVWLLGVWQVGLRVHRAALDNATLRRQLAAVLPDLTDDDIRGSCFAISGYHVAADLGGEAALARLRERLHQRGLGLFLDFIPNHVGLDHPWVAEHPEWFVHGTAADLAVAPNDWLHLPDHQCPTILAHGRDPHFPGWSDTLQLNYSQPGLVAAMVAELIVVAAQCDGVRCDMAMLVLPDVFEATWGRPGMSFWPTAIDAVRATFPHFFFLAEAYWGRESQLLAEGFDACYDKQLYDRLRDSRAPAIQRHLAHLAHLPGRPARFLENHDELRATATFPPDQHMAAAVITYLSPGLRFFQHGQREGRRVRVPVQLLRAPAEPDDPFLPAFYEQLWALLRDPLFRDGTWHPLTCAAVDDLGDLPLEVLAWLWTSDDGNACLVAVNYAPHARSAVLPAPSIADGYGVAHLAWPHSRPALDAYRVDRGWQLDLGPWAFGIWSLTAATMPAIAQVATAHAGG